MKRIKIMLLSFALLAVVGGALAFKAKFTKFPYCTTTLGGNTTACVLVSSATSQVGPRFLYTTAQPNGIGGFDCTTIIDDEIVPLICETPTTLVVEGQ